jgi:hypothetical protein
MAEALLKRAPGAPDFMALLGVIRYRLEKPEEAEAALREALGGSVSPGPRCAAEFTLAILERNRGDPKGARAWFDTASAHLTDDPTFTWSRVLHEEAKAALGVSKDGDEKK